jgi:hypothetical protein
MAEPTYEQVLQALQAADAAGNVEDARQLAQMAASMAPKPAGMQQVNQPPVKESATSYGSFGRRAASLADVTLGGVLPAIAQTVGYPLARTVMSPEQAQAATERVVSAIDKPFGKAASVLTGTDITRTPEYQTEAGRQIMDFIGTNFQKGAKWISENTGVPQADVESYMATLGIAAPSVAKPALRAAAPIVEEAAAKVKAGVQAPFEDVIKARNERLSAEDYARGPQIEAAQEAQRLGILLKPTDIQSSVGTRLTTAMGGEAGLEKITAVNKNNVRKVALNEMGLPPDTQLNGPNAFVDARSKLAKPYNDIRSLPTMTADDNVVSSLEALRPDTALIGKERFATQLNKDIDTAIKNVTEGLDGNQILKNIQTLRKDARRTYNNKNSDVAALDKADSQLAMASVLEGMVESNVFNPRLLQQFRDARQKMARVYAYEGATDFNTGMIDVNRLAKITAKDNAMSGDIASLGKIAGNFPDAFSNRPVKQGVDQAKIGRTGLAGSLGGLAGYAIDQGYTGGVIGSLIGAGAGELAQSVAARRMANPEYQAGLTIADRRLPSNRPPVETPPIPQNRAVVPYQASVEVLPPAAPAYQPNFTIPQGTPVATRAPYTPMDMFLTAPGSEATLQAFRADDIRRAELSRAVGKQREVNQAAVEASDRRPTRGGVQLELDPVTGRLREVSQGVKGATPETFRNFGASLENASIKVADGRTFDLTAAEKVAWEKTKADLSEAMPSFKVLSEKAVAERMMTRDWVSEAATKAREKAAMFEQLALRSKNIREFETAKANRERMLDLAGQMEEKLRSGRPDLSRKVQGPKTRAAKREEGLFRIDLTNMAPGRE